MLLLPTIRGKSLEVLFEPCHGKICFGVPDQVRYKPAVQPQKMTRGLKYLVLEVEGLFSPYSKNKGADHLRGHQAADPGLYFCIC